MPFDPISVGIGVGGRILSGIFGSRAAKRAAEQQARAAQEAARQAMVASRGAADDLTATGDWAAQGILGAGDNAMTGVRQMAEGGAQRILGAAERGQQGIRLSADEANELLRSIYGDAIAALAPYREGGATAFTTLSEMVNPGGEFNRQFTAADMELDPGYQFRLAEGQKALERSAAARGGLQSGAALKALSRYSQGVASDEYQKAFDRFRANRGDRFSVLSNLAGTGLRAAESGIAAGENYGSRAANNVMSAGEFGANLGYRGAADASTILQQAERDAGDFGTRAWDTAGRLRLGAVGDAGRFHMQGAELYGNAITGAGNARAAGTIGSANAWSSTLSGIANTAMEAAAGRRRP